MSASMTPPEPPRGRRGTTRVSWPVAIATGVGAVLLATAAVIAVFVVTDGVDPAGLPVGTAFLMPADYEHPEPFTPSVASVGPSAARFSSPSLDGTADRLTGDTPGLYGSSSEQPLCDGTALVAALAADPQLARTWAEAAAVDISAIESTINSLTPVVLGADVVVTNHLYRGGEAIAFQAVLESGTAVMVDAHGVPRVQCSCGNPLLPPEETSSYEGQAWDGFDDTEVVTVDPSPEPIPQIPTIDIDTGEPSTPPQVELDGLLVADDSGVHVLDESSGNLTRVLDRPVAEVFDDGAGGLLFNPARSESVSEGGLISEAPSTPEEASIWHLPAGAAEPVQLISSSDPNAQWHVLLGAGTLGGRRYMAYATLRWDSEGGGLEHPVGSGPVLLRDLESGQDVTVEEVGFGWELYSGPFSFNADRLAYDQGYASGWFVVRGPDLQRIPNACAPSDETAYDDPGDCPYADAIDGNGRAIDIESYDQETGDKFSYPDLVAYSLPNFTEVARWPLSELTAADSAVVNVDVVDHRAVVSVTKNRRPTGVPAQSVDLSSGEKRSTGVSGLVRILRAPLVRPAGSVNTGARSPSVDVRNVTLPSGACSTGDGGWQHGPITLVDGEGESFAADDSYGASIMDAKAVGMADFDGDGDQEILMTANCAGSRIEACCAGRASILMVALVLEPHPDGSVTLLAPPIMGGRSGGEMRAIGTVSLEGATVITTEHIVYPESVTGAVGHDPFEPVTVRYELRGAEWVEHRQ